MHCLGYYQSLKVEESYMLFPASLAHETNKMLKHNLEKNLECEEVVKALKMKLVTYEIS